MILRPMKPRPIIPMEPRRALQLRIAAARKLHAARRRKKGGARHLERELVRLTAASLAHQMRALARQQRTRNRLLRYAEPETAPPPIADLFGHPELCR